MGAPTKFRAVGCAIAKPLGYESCYVAAVLQAGQPIDLTDEKRWLLFESRRTPIEHFRYWHEVRFDDRGIDKNGVTVPPRLSPADHKVAPITSIGPLPALPFGQYIGAVYFEHGYFMSIFDDYIKDPKGKVPWKLASYANYELTSIAIETDDPVASPQHSQPRYHGVHAKVIDRANPKAVKVDLYVPGDHTAVAKQVTLNFESDQVLFDDKPDLVDLWDPTSGHEKMLTATSADGDVGGLYVNLQTLAAELFAVPKIPRGMGQ
jgi:hypothetical protein